MPALRLPSPLVLLFCCVWSSAFIVGKAALAHCPPLLLLALRFLAAAPVLYAMAAATGQRIRPDRVQAAWLAALGLCNNALYLGCAFTALPLVKAGIVVAALSFSPLLTTLLAAPLLGERVRPATLPAMLACMAGIWLATLPPGLPGLPVLDGLDGLPELGGDAATLLPGLGTLLSLAAALALALGTVLFKRASARLGGLGLFSVVGHQSLAGGMLLLPVALATEDPATLSGTPEFLGAFAYLVLAVSVGATALWFRIVRTSSAATAASSHFLNPVFATLLGWMVLGETVQPREWMGMALVLAGMALGEARRSPRRSA